MEDNTKHTFENDIYSKEFFNFIKEIMANIVNGQDIKQKQALQLGLGLGKKVAFDFLARLENNYDFKVLVHAIV